MTRQSCDEDGPRKVGDPLYPAGGYGDRLGDDHRNATRQVDPGHEVEDHSCRELALLDAARLELGRPEVSEDLAVARVRRVRPEHDRCALGSAEDLVEQRELHLAEPGAAEVRAEMRGPQAAVLDDRLERRDQRLADGIVQVVRLLDDQVERLALLPDELLDPLQLGGVLGIGEQ